ncbi:MAG: phosphoglycerate dehydrogenase [Candidatus Promineifilaceae bacterium]
MYKILVSDKLGQVGLDRLKAADDVQVDVKLGLPKDELLQIIPEYDALIVRSETKVDADVLAAATKLKVVGRAGMGVDNIDVKVATRRGVIVMNTPGANSIATAEQTMALMLAVSRHTAPAHASLKAGEWNRNKFVGTELYGKTLGVIGFGRIGRLVAKRAQSFGMEILAFDPFVSESVARDLGVTLVDLDDLYAQADYITLHTAMTPETAKMINAEAIAQMKKGVVIVNVARGKLIDEAALADALKSGQVKAAAIDVFSTEPPAPDNPILGLPNVLHTPHLGASSEESQRAVATEIADQILNALRGSDFRNSVNLAFEEGIDFAAARPYMQLAEKLGTIQAALAPSPLRKVELEVRGEVDKLVRPIAAALLKGIISYHNNDTGPVNLINAPLLAEDRGLSISQSRGFAITDYNNLISCKVSWDGGERTLSGVLFGGSEPRIVQVDGFLLEAKPQGVLLVLANNDVPGVIGQVGTILSAYSVNIGEWRMGRLAPGSGALSFINLDSIPPHPVLDALSKISAVTQVTLVELK